MTGGHSSCPSSALLDAADVEMPGSVGVRLGRTAVGTFGTAAVAA
jgi:hypothetical protein